jgi:hypothetical protein
VLLTPGNHIIFSLVLAKVDALFTA